MPERRILLIAPKASYRLGDFRAAARELGVELRLVTDRCRRVADRHPGEILAPFDRPGELVETVAAAVARSPVQAVVALDDAGAVAAAHIAQRLRLPFNRPAAVRRTRNKLMFRHRIHAAGLPSPRFHIADIDREPEIAAQRATYPCVLKPLLLSGSRGVIRANNPEKFVRAFRRIRNLLLSPELRQSGCRRAMRTLLIESYIPGREIAIEALLTCGKPTLLALFDKPDPLEGPFFEETIYVTPPALTRAQRQQIAEALARACRAVGLTHGPVHAEARFAGDRVVFLEIAPRTIGGLCSRILQFATGRRLEEIVLRHSLGLPLPPLKMEGAAGVMMIPIPRAGMLHGVHGREEAEAVPGVVGVEITHPMPHLLVPLPEGGSYLGFLFAVGESAAAVIASLRRAHSCLRFDIRTALSVVS